MVEVYVEKPPGFESGNKVYRLNKALYGFKQALSTVLVDNGFCKGKVNWTLFKINDGEDMLRVQIYVDCIIFSSSNASLGEKFAELMKRQYKMSMMGRCPTS